ncbi:MAG: hypothetical protein EPO40_09440 [Myxococcaceae bacterium]|nr:MAG: hypothetical protein EPO40_09440 [Myxococcaceae bacterium]
MTFLSMAAVGGAQAQENPAEIARRELIAQAERARQDGDHTRALDLALRAGAVRWTPSLRLLAAQEYSAVGHLLDAYGMALTCTREAEADPAMRNRDRVVGACRGVADSLEPRVGRLILRVRDPVPTGLQVRIAGAVLPPALWGVAYPVLPGVVRVDATAPDHESVRNEVAVVAGEVSETTLDLVRLPPEPLNRPPMTATGVPAGAVPPTARESANGRTLRTLGWIGIGTAAVGVGVGGLALGLREESASAFNRECPAGPPGSLSAVCQSRIDTGSTLSSVMLSGFIVGGAATVAAVVLFVAAPPSRGVETPARAWVCGPQLVPVGAGCTGQF